MFLLLVVCDGTQIFVVLIMIRALSICGLGRPLKNHFTNLKSIIRCSLNNRSEKLLNNLERQKSFFTNAKK